MSRRRKTYGNEGNKVFLYVECDGREDHPVERIARVMLTPRPDLDLDGGWAVHVEYRRAADDPEENDYTMYFREYPMPHNTRRFPCRLCGRDWPVKDEHLVPLVLRVRAMGHARVRLREMTTATARLTDE